MDPYSGLFELFEKQQLIVKEGNRYKYVTKAGEEIKMFRKEWQTDEDSMKIIMNEFTQDDLRVVVDINDDDKINIPVTQGDEA